MVSLPGDALRVLVEGENRFLIRELKEEDGCPFAAGEMITENNQTGPEQVALIRTTQHVFEEYARNNGSLSAEMLRSVQQVKNASALADLIASNALTRFEDRIAVLQETDPEKRLETLDVILIREGELSAIERTVQQRLKQRMSLREIGELEQIVDNGKMP